MASARNPITTTAAIGRSFELVPSDGVPVPFLVEDQAAIEGNFVQRVAFRTTTNPTLGADDANDFTPTFLAPVVAGDLLFVTVAHDDHPAVVCSPPAGQGWQQIPGTAWGGGGRFATMFFKAWGQGFTDVLNPLFTFSGPATFIANGGVLIGLDVAAGIPVLTASAATQASPAAAIATTAAAVNSGGVSVRAVWTNEPDQVINQAFGITGARAFAASNNAAFKFSETQFLGGESSWRVAIWLEAHLLGGRVSALAAGPQVDPAAVSLAQLTATFQGLSA